ncbi:MAG: CU044_5270 family protein [Actinomycetota bacterium]|nr:CU044_5270 family protein [Actinomycetota bacterium]
MANNRSTLHAQSELELLHRTITSAGLLPLIEAPHEENGLESAEDFVTRMKSIDAHERAIGVRRRLRHFSLAGSSLVAAAALTLFVLQPWQQPVAAADTPPVLDFEFAAARNIAYAPGEDPRAELLALSSAAAEQRPESPEGKVQHVVTDNWFAAVDDNLATAAVVPQIDETWLSPDGSLRLVQKRATPLAADGRGLPTAGSWEDFPATADETLPAGSNDADLAHELPADPEGVRDELLSMRGCEDRRRGLARSFCLHQQIVELHRSHVVPSQTHATMWRMLADEEGFRLLGKVKDRAGREGIGISLISDRDPSFRNVLIISPTTGELLGSEEILIKTLPKFDLGAPAITGFTAFLESEYRDGNR